MKGMSSSKKRSAQKHVTISPVSGDKVALDTVNKNFYVQGLTRTVEANSLTDLINITAHGAIEGDIVRFKTGLNTGIEATILKVINANSFELGSNLPNLPTITDTFDIMRALSGTVDQNGNMITTAAPIKYVLDGVDTVVKHDTVTPSNNAPLPVEIMNTSGSVTITAGNINVQLSHTGAQPDSTKIGDGTNLLGITLSNEAKVTDAQVLTAIGSLLTELGLKANLTETQPVSAVSLPLPAGASTDTTLNLLINELALKANLTETQPVSALSLPLPTGAATQTTLSQVLSTLGLLAKLTDTQPVSAASLPLPAGASTEVTLAAADTKLGLLAKLTDTQPVSAATLPLPAGASTEATLTAQSAKLPASLGQKTSVASMSVVMASDYTPIALTVKSYTIVDAFATNITTAAFLSIHTSPAGGIKKIQTIDDIGEFMAIATGAVGFETIIAYLPLGGGEIEVSIAAGVQISIISLYNNVTLGHMALNFLG